MKKIIAVVVLAIILYILMKFWSKSSNVEEQAVISNDNNVSNNPLNSGLNNNPINSTTNNPSTSTGSTGIITNNNNVSNNPLNSGSSNPSTSTGTTGGNTPTGSTGIITNNNHVSNNPINIGNVSTGGNTPTGPNGPTGNTNPFLPIDPNCGLGGVPNSNGVCGSTFSPRLSGTISPVLTDPRNPNNPPTLYVDDNIVNPVLPMSSGTLSIGICNNALNNNSNYISILTGSALNPTHISQFLDNMRIGYANGETNPNSSGCNFLKRRQLNHNKDLNLTIASEGYISSPNHRDQKQAKLDFLTATIDNCCQNNTSSDINNNLNLVKGKNIGNVSKGVE